MPPSVASTRDPPNRVECAPPRPSRRPGQPRYTRAVPARPIDRPPARPSDARVERRRYLARPSPLARWGAALYAIALAYGTLYPLADWRTVGAGALDFLTEPPPRYWTWFDLATNVGLYVPLGWLGTLALWPRRVGAGAIAGVTLGAGLLSLGLEALQTYLPSRIPSNFDWFANAAGAFVGVLLGRATGPALLAHGPLRAWRFAWFRHDASAAILLLVLWLIAQIQPQPLLMGTGELLEPLLHALQATGAFEPGELDWDLAADRFILIEAASVLCALGGIGVLVLEALRPQAPRTALVGALIGVALAIRAAASAVLLRPADAFSWLTAGAQAGLLAAAVLLFAIAALRRRARLVAGVLLLALGVLLVNLAPENAYYAEMIERWDEGRWLNFNGMTRLVATIWPYCAIAYLLRRCRRTGRRSPVDRRSDPSRLEAAWHGGPPHGAERRGGRDRRDRRGRYRDDTDPSDDDLPPLPPQSVPAPGERGTPAGPDASIGSSRIG